MDQRQGGMMKFQTTIELGGKTATGMRVPAEVVERLGKGKKPPVKVTIGAYTYRSTVAVYGGDYFLPVSAEVRQSSGVKAGDEVEVEIELDTEPRQVTVPPDLAQALESAPDARRFFNGLSYSNQRRLVLAIEGAKTPETRRRRIESTIDKLKEARV
jgi:hypothetical protein